MILLLLWIPSALFSKLSISTSLISPPKLIKSLVYYLKENKTQKTSLTHQQSQVPSSFSAPFHRKTSCQLCTVRISRSFINSPLILKLSVDFHKCITVQSLKCPKSFTRLIKKPKFSDLHILPSTPFISLALFPLVVNCTTLIPLTTSDSFCFRWGDLQSQFIRVDLM